MGSMNLAQHPECDNLWGKKYFDGKKPKSAEHNINLYKTGASPKGAALAAPGFAYGGCAPAPAPAPDEDDPEGISCFLVHGCTTHDIIRAFCTLPTTHVSSVPHSPLDPSPNCALYIALSRSHFTHQYDCRARVHGAAWPCITS